MDWAGEKYVMEQVGYKVVYDPTFDITTSQFDHALTKLEAQNFRGILKVTSLPGLFCLAGNASEQTELKPFVPLGPADQAVMTRQLGQAVVPDRRHLAGGDLRRRRQRGGVRRAAPGAARYQQDPCLSAHNAPPTAGPMLSILAHGDRVAHPALRRWTRAWHRA